MNDGIIHYANIKLKRMEINPDYDYTLEHNNPLMEPMIIIDEQKDK